MLSFGPISETPISSLKENGLGEVEIEFTFVMEGRRTNPISEIVQDPRNILVLSAEITSLEIA